MWYDVTWYDIVAIPGSVPHTCALSVINSSIAGFFGGGGTTHQIHP